MPGRHIRVTIPGTYAEVCFVRRVLPLVAVDLAFPQATLLRLEICLTEALHNVIRHGYAGLEGQEIEVTFHALEGRLVIEIADRGAPMPETARKSLRARHVPVRPRAQDVAALPVGGLGIPILREVMDDIEYRRDGDRNVLTLMKRTEALAESDSSR
ncbi:MAG: ATP-binding protein [bacterium]